MSVSVWMERNLATQGYCLSTEEASRLRIGLRFPTGVCLPLVAAALALESVPVLLGLAAIGAVAGFTPRHPFDLLWNHGVRHLVGAPAVPQNPTRRRHAFKIGTAWLLALAALFVAGQDGLALGLGLALLGACSTVTFTNFCIPSATLALLERLRAARAATT
jgi:hypothetical protein